VVQVQRRTRRRWLLTVAGAVIVLLVVLSALSGFYVDLLWFREVQFSTVFWSVFWTKVVLGAVFGFLFFVLLAANLLIARRLAPRFRPFSPEQEVMERYRQAVEPYLFWMILGFAALIALFVGIAAAARWETFLMWRSVGDVRFGVTDPVFNRDPSYYVFVLPFQKFIQGWLFSALVGITVLAAIAHYLTGGIRTQTVGEKVTPQVKAHLSVLLGLIVLVKAWGYFLGRYDLLLSPRGTVVGASYTDVHAQLPALTVLVVIALICGVLFLVNIRFRGWVLPVLGIGLLALTSIVAGAVVPAWMQRFIVAPQELQRERQYIDYNIEWTRRGFGLDQIDERLAPVSPQVTAEQVDQNEPTISNVRLWDPSILQVTYRNLQRIQPYYEFPDVDVDRYTIQGERRVVMISAREISQNGIPGGGQTWQNRHLVYTHGYGAVASRVNAVTPEGLPLYELRDIPPRATGGDIQLDPDTGSQLYYQENADVPYIAVDTKSPELNYPGGGDGQQEFVETSYGGTGGISIGAFLRKALFAYHYRDINLLISDLIEPDSRLLINRDIRTRVSKAAPFLQYDGDPYVAIVDGRLVYIWDAYTTTDLYPYSDRVNLADATGGSARGGMDGRANYIRNSVKAVVDAYDGTVTLYVVDPQDPMIQVWARAFPGLFTMEPAPQSMQDHFRYPENLLQVQALQYTNYHVTESSTFYSKRNFWAIPGDPASRQGAGDRLRPYYVLIKLPGEEQEEFVLFIPFTPFNRPNMIGYLAGKSDPGSYGELVSFEFPSGNPPDGPQQVFARINQDPVFARERTLLDQTGSNVVFGNLFIVPIEDSFLYVQPVFVISSQQNAIPELKRVVVVNGQTVRVGNTFPEAMAASIGEPVPPTEDGGEEPPPPSGEVAEVADLLDQALHHFRQADELLRQGDLAGYQREVNAAQDLIRQAGEISGAPAAEPSPSPGG
jgi:uncharacterized protein